MHSIYDQPDAAAVHAQFDRVVEALAEKLPAVAEHLEQARPDILASAAFPKETRTVGGVGIGARSRARTYGGVGGCREGTLARLAQPGPVVTEQAKECGADGECVDGVLRDDARSQGMGRSG